MICPATNLSCTQVPKGPGQTTVETGWGWGEVTGSGPADTQVKSVDLKNDVVRGQIIGFYFIAQPPLPPKKQT